MTMQDPIADMLTHIRNAQMVNHPEVEMPSSKLKIEIAKVLLKEGYIEEYRMSGDEKKPRLVVRLKYFQGKPVIEKIARVSRPGLRTYKNSKEIPQVQGGLGISIISTNQGVLSSREAKNQGLGGEVLCTVF